MIIDTSAIIAVLLEESGFEAVRRQFAQPVDKKIGAPTKLEAGMVLMGRYGVRGNTVLERFLQQNDIKTVPFTDEHAEIALDAFNRFGKGRHKASLNYGDCMTYASAYLAREPLLFVGSSFTQTDLELVELG
jgi:ribonuclease VapC